jgi:hypothetical protein
MAGEPRGALFAPGMLPAGMERKRRRHGASCPGGMESAAGWRFRVFFEDSRNGAPGPAENRQVQQGREQSGPKRPICISCPQTRRNNNHGCRVRKRHCQVRCGAGICNKEIGRRSRSPRPRALRSARRPPRAPLGLEQVHRRGADEDGRGGRAPRDRQKSRKLAAQRQTLNPRALGRWYCSRYSER